MLSFSSFIILQRSFDSENVILLFGFLIAIDLDMSFTSKEKEILPKNVRPLHYAIELAPDLTSFLTDGTVVIDLEVLEDSPKICINANQIKISDVELKRDDESPSLKPTSSRYVCSHISEFSG